MKPYKPDHRSSATGLALAALAAILGGLAVGGLLFLVSKFVYFIIIFPVGAGFLAGAILERAVKTGKVRIPLFAVICGLLMGLIAYTSYHFYDYLQIRLEARQEIMDELSKSPFGAGSDAGNEEMAEEIIDGELIGETGQPGFWGYIFLNLRDGMTIENARTKSVFTFTPLTTLLVWVAETGIIGVMAAVMGKRQSERPFCQTHNCWYDPSSHLGGFKYDGSNFAVNQIKNGEFEQIAQLLEEDAPAPSTEIFVAKCPECADHFDSLPWIEISHAFLYRGKLQHKHVCDGVISQAQFLTLSRGKQA